MNLASTKLSHAAVAAVFLLGVLSCQAGRSQDSTPGADSVQTALDGVAKMSPGEQQAWLVQLEQRAARAARQTLSPEEAAKQQAKTQKLLHQKMVTWQVLRDVLADTDARERTVKAAEVAKEQAAKAVLEKERAAKIAGEKAAQKAAEAAKQQAVEAVKENVAKAVEALKTNVAKAMEAAKTQPAESVKPQAAKVTTIAPASEKLTPGSVTVNAEELDARIAGCNLAFRELEATLNEKVEWNAAKLEPLLDRLKELVVRHDDLGLIRAAASKEQRVGVTRLETTKSAISQLSARVVEARNRASDPKFSGDDVERQAELVRLDAISHRLAELGEK